MMKSKEEILSHELENNYSSEKYDAALTAMQKYSDQQTANLYTKEEVQKIVENVREAVIENSFVIYEQKANKLCPDACVDRDRMRSLDLNKFIPKK